MQNKRPQLKVISGQCMTACRSIILSIFNSLLKMLSYSLLMVRTSTTKTFFCSFACQYSSFPTWKRWPPRAWHQWATGIWLGTEVSSNHRYITLGSILGTIWQSYCTDDTFKLYLVPCKGLLERTQRVCSYLYRMKHDMIRFHYCEPDFSDLPDFQFDWEASVYGNDMYMRIYPKTFQHLWDTFLDCHIMLMLTCTMTWHRVFL